MAEALTNEVVTKFGVTFTEHADTPVFTTTDAHGLSVDDLISVTAGILGEELSLGEWNEETRDWVYDSGTEYTIATVPSDTTFTLTGDFNTSTVEGEKKIEYHPLEATDSAAAELVAIIEEAAESEKAAIVEAQASSTQKWEQFTIGQNSTIQDIVSAAAKASDLLNTNVKLAKTGLQLAQAFLLGVLNPKILILNAIADQIDAFLKDFLGTGFYLLQVVPSGKETAATDEWGERLKLVMTSEDVNASWTATQKEGDAAKENFLKWTKTALKENNFAETGATKSQYLITIGKSQPKELRTENANDNSVATKDSTFGFYKMTPSQVITQIIGAMDDKLDERRPQFSSSADVSAVVIIVGFQSIGDPKEMLASFTNALNALVAFFGGENGMATKGFQKLGNLLAAATNQVEDPTKNNVTITVKNISGVRGTVEDGIELLKQEVDYNTPKVFEMNDFVIGPKISFGKNAMGYVSNVVSTTSDDPMAPYSSQVLTITGAGERDFLAFGNIANGAKLQKVHWYVNKYTWTDENTGAFCTGADFNDFKYLQELSNEEATKAVTKVKREGGNTLLTKVSEVDVTETYSGHIVKTSVIGTVVSPQKKKAPPPNFSTFKLEDLLGGFSTFFSAINTLSDTLRNMAGDSATALDDIIEFLDSKITELDEINTALQSILKIFTDGLPDAGVYTLVIDGATGGNDAIKSAIQGASDRPPDTLDMSMGFMLMGDKSSMAVLNKLLTANKP